LELYRYDIAGSIAHAAALTQAGIITADERQKIENELRAIEREIGSGKFEWDQSLEDVHMNIEATLTKRIGAVGGSFTLSAAGTTRWRWIFGFM
jgi:argininosuccinate lyase